jgi:hypothetical protein
MISQPKAVEKVIKQAADAVVQPVMTRSTP